MKVILLDNIRALGKVGEVKDVRDGYARNFLFPRNMARIASEGVMKDVEQTKAKKLAAFDLAQKEAEKIADTLKDTVIELTAAANEQGTLFAAVEPEHVATELSAKAEVKIEPSHLTISEPIKTIGEHTVTVELAEDVTLEIKVLVSKN